MSHLNIAADYAATPRSFLQRRLRGLLFKKA
nr:MAG TPA: hypothetical protein [Caudoviricetes sp.]